MAISRLFGPEIVEAFIKNTFTAMIGGISDEVLGKRIIHKKELESGMKDLNTIAQGGTFCYTFFKAKAKK